MDLTIVRLHKGYTWRVYMKIILRNEGLTLKEWDEFRYDFSEAWGKVKPLVTKTVNMLKRKG